MSEPARQGGRSGRWLWPVAVLLIALLARLGYPTPVPFIDEFFHMLSAKSLLATGQMKLAPEAPKPYRRAALFTYAVAGSMAVFGESWWSVRLPAVLAGALVVAGVFVFVRTEAGTGAAWAASMLLCFVPEFLDLSKWCRFYTWQMLTVFCGAALLYRAAKGRGAETTQIRWAKTIRGRVLCGGGSAMLFALAIHLQPTSLIAAGAAGVWLLAVWWRPRPRSESPWRPGVAFYGGLLVLTIAVVAAAWWSGIPQHYAQVYYRPRLWAAAHGNDLGFYQRQMIESRPVLWALFPAAIITAIWRRPRLGAFAVVMFAAPFVVHSLVWVKAGRYLWYAMPFFYVIWGVAAAAWLGAIRAQAMAVWRNGMRGGGERSGPAVVTVSVAVLVAFALYRTPDYYQAIRAYRGDLNALPYHHVNWEPAVADLRPWFNRAEVVLSGEGPKALYYFGGYDYGINRSIMSEHTEGKAYRYDGRPMLGRVASLEQLRREHATGLILADDSTWNAPTRVPPEMVAWIKANAQPLPTPAGLHAYWWGSTPQGGPQ